MDFVWTIIVMAALAIAVCVLIWACIRCIVGLIMNRVAPKIEVPEAEPASDQDRPNETEIAQADSTTDDD